MNIEKKYKTLMNPIMYYKVIGPGHHKELMGCSRPVNMFELMHRVNSEGSKLNNWKEDFEGGVFKGSNREVKLAHDVVPKKFISYVPIKKFAQGSKPLNTKIVESDKYPWRMLAKSIENVGFESLLIVDMTDRGDLVVIEGKHRVAASTLIEPFNPEFIIPCLVISLDRSYTIKMWKQPHPYPLSGDGKYKKFDRK